MKLYPSIATFVTCGRVAHKTSRQFVGKWIATHHINNQGQLLPCFHFFVMENWTSMQIAQKSVSKSIQNECAADTTGGVQKGLGMLPQQTIYEDWPSGEIKKMSKPVQVCTACQFVTPIIYGQNYSQVGNKKLIHLHLNWVEVSNLTSAQLEQKLIRTCSQLGHKLYVERKLANRAKLQHFVHFRIFSFASICKMTCQGKFPDTLWTSISLMAARSSWTLFL